MVLGCEVFCSRFVVLLNAKLTFCCFALVFVRSFWNSELLERARGVETTRARGAGEGLGRGPRLAG